MNTPLKTPDPLLQSLLEEEKALAVNAAAHARRRYQTGANIRRAAGVLTILLLSVGGIWLVNHSPLRLSSRSMENKNHPINPTLPPTAAGFVRVQRVDDPAVPAIPDDAGEEERRLLAALPGVPVVLVKDAAGRITRVHIIER